MRVISPEHDVDLYLSNSYGVDSEGNIVRGNLLTIKVILSFNSS